MRLSRLSLVIWASVWTAQASEFVTHSFPAIGTRISVTYEAPRNSALERQIEDLFKELDAEASLYRDDSRLSQLNASTPGSSLKIGPMLCRLLKAGIAMTRATEGRFDITYKAPAVDALTLDCSPERGGVATRKTRDVFVDLNGIAAGFIADEVGALLKSKNRNHFLVDSGGELLVCGRKGDRPWSLGIEDPSNPQRLLKTFQLTESPCAALSTSGDSQRAIIKDGKRLSYIVNPKSGKSVEGARLVTVYGTGSAAEVDALSTGLSSGLNDGAYLKRIKSKFKVRIFAIQGQDPTLREL